jgi:hypothetical protein
MSMSLRAIADRNFRALRHPVGTTLTKRPFSHQKKIELFMSLIQEYTNVKNLRMGQVIEVEKPTIRYLTNSWEPTQLSLNVSNG